ncbi:hypothetical protein ACFXDH_42720 [Streptomyces sp. NPDC059467]|uniref:hypothetical protein n=1 Tax=Streptomyces sp. NPDC059467 TaxID=3346844 RepID=UPI00367B74FB
MSGQGMNPDNDGLRFRRSDWGRVEEAASALRRTQYDLLHGAGSAERTLAGALGHGSPYRSEALEILRGHPQYLDGPLLRQVMDLCLSHRWCGQAREVAVRTPGRVVAEHLADIVRDLLDADDADEDAYDTYRRLAEALEEMRAWDVLAVLVRRASAHASADVREVADDFLAVFRDVEAAFRRATGEGPGR